MSLTLLDAIPTPRPSQRLLTAADLAALPSDLPSGTVKYELDDGVLVVMPPPGDIHGFQQVKILRFLDVYADASGVGQARGEIGVVLRRDPDRVVGPDACFILAKSLPVRRSREGYLETIPELVVEVRSRNDRLPEVREKVDEYLAAGTVAVWLLDAADRTVTEYRASGTERTFTATEELTCPDLLPGFIVAVARLFPVD